MAQIWAMVQNLLTLDLIIQRDLGYISIAQDLLLTHPVDNIMLIGPGE